MMTAQGSTLGTFEARRPHERPKVMTITRIPTPGGPIPVSVGTFARFGLGWGTMPAGIIHRLGLRGLESTERSEAQA